MILFESHAVKLEFDPTIPCIIWTPLDFMSGDQWKEPFIKGVEFFEKKIQEVPHLEWLNDTRKLKSVKIGDVQWVDQWVNPRVKEAGLKKNAFVLPDDIFAKMSIRAYIRFTETRKDSNFQIKGFESVANAKMWLKGNDDVDLGEIKI